MYFSLNPKYDNIMFNQCLQEDLIWKDEIKPITT